MTGSKACSPGVAAALDNRAPDGAGPSARNGGDTYATDKPGVGAPENVDPDDNVDPADNAAHHVNAAENTAAARTVRQAHMSNDESIDAGYARDFSEMARQLQAENDPAVIMQRIVRAAVFEIPGATDAAITLVQHGVVSSPVHTSETATLVGQAQSDTGEGPCLDTSRQEITMRADDLESDSRWPNFGPIAVSHGVRSILSFQLFVERDKMGALDVYADTAHAFTAESENIGLLLASHAAIAMSANRQVANLRAAVDTRDLIGQAKGVLMERYKINAAQSFDLLVASSQALHRKLRDIADELVSTGELPVPRHFRH